MWVDDGGGSLSPRSDTLRALGTPPPEPRKGDPPLPVSVLRTDAMSAVSVSPSSSPEGHPRRPGGRGIHSEVPPPSLNATPRAAAKPLSAFTSTSSQPEQFGSSSDPLSSTIPQYPDADTTPFQQKWAAFSSTHQQHASSARAHVRHTQPATPSVLSSAGSPRGRHPPHFHGSAAAPPGRERPTGHRSPPALFTGVGGRVGGMRAPGTDSVVTLSPRSPRETQTGGGGGAGIDDAPDSRACSTPGRRAAVSDRPVTQNSQNVPVGGVLRRSASPSDSDVPTSATPAPSLTCPMCLELLGHPYRLPCAHVVCANCISTATSPTPLHPGVPATPPQRTHVRSTFICPTCKHPAAPAGGPTSPGGGASGAVLELDTSIYKTVQALKAGAGVPCSTGPARPAGKPRPAARPKQDARAQRGGGEKAGERQQDPASTAPDAPASLAFLPRAPPAAAAAAPELCEKCEARGAELACGTCDVLLCAPCNETHHVGKLRSHRLSRLPGAGAPQHPPLACCSKAGHEKYTADIVDLKTNDVLCLLCLQLDGRRDPLSCVPFDAARGVIEKKLSVAAAEAQRVRAAVLEKVVAVDGFVNAAREDARRAVQKVRRQFKEMRKAMEKAEVAVVDQVVRGKNSCVSGFERERASLAACVSSLNILIALENPRSDTVPNLAEKLSVARAYLANLPSTLLSYEPGPVAETAVHVDPTLLRRLKTAVTVQPAHPAAATPAASAPSSPKAAYLRSSTPQPAAQQQAAQPFARSHTHAAPRTKTLESNAAAAPAAAATARQGGKAKDADRKALKSARPRSGRAPGKAAGAAPSGGRATPENLAPWDGSADGNDDAFVLSNDDLPGNVDNHDDDDDEEGQPAVENGNDNQLDNDRPDVKSCSEAADHTANGSAPNEDGVHPAANRGRAATHTASGKAPRKRSSSAPQHARRGSAALVAESLASGRRRKSVGVPDNAPCATPPAAPSDAPPQPAAGGKPARPKRAPRDDSLQRAHARPAPDQANGHHPSVGAARKQRPASVEATKRPVRPVASPPLSPDSSALSERAARWAGARREARASPSPASRSIPPGVPTPASSLEAPPACRFCWHCGVSVANGVPSSHRNCVAHPLFDSPSKRSVPAAVQAAQRSTSTPRTDDRNSYAFQHMQRTATTQKSDWRR
ncbi:hypothetical protein DIPPA_18270 [Diplonema papillatum]|nr:hypothetical protein DIPPA_18270 [Diplonema papillatum]